MSDLVRSFVKAKLNAMPHMLKISEDESEENGKIGTDERNEEDVEKQEDGSSSASSISSVGTVRAKAEPDSQAQSLGWSTYFDQELFLNFKMEKKSAKYHVYISPPRKSDAPLIVFHHGAGSSGMSFAILTSYIREIYPEIGILALEARGHGSTVWNDSGELDMDMSMRSLSHDMVQMISLTKEKLKWSAMPRLVLIGHSLGGAVIVEVAKQRPFGDKVIAFAVIDIVEGSAIEALTLMQSYLSTRPLSFTSIDEAIEWHIKSRTIRNPLSAKVSVPALLVSAGKGCYDWKTNLSATQPFWRDWFTGLSYNFLSARGAKLLILAGTDRLDKELMIGQMQGKFQLQVVPTSGHFVHEDVPERTADLIIDFVKRNDQSTLILPPKVSDLLKQNSTI